MVFISFFRGTPLMAKLFCFYFGIIHLFSSLVLIDSRRKEDYSIYMDNMGDFTMGGMFTIYSIIVILLT